jgi:hypothetical protein
MASGGTEREKRTIVASDKNGQRENGDPPAAGWKRVEMRVVESTTETKSTARAVSSRDPKLRETQSKIGSLRSG